MQGNRVNHPSRQGAVYNHRPLEERFWDKVDKSNLYGCWIWTGCKTNGNFNYGFFGMKIDGIWRRVNAPKLSWEMANGRKVPKGLLVCHTCNNPPCVRPDHLYVGTHVDNSRDAQKAGHLIRKKGEDNVWAKLTWELVRQIRYDYSSSTHRKDGRGHASPVSQRALAQKYGVSRAVIRNVLSHTTWKEF